MNQPSVSDEQVEREIEALKQSPYVKLAKREQNLKNRRRQWLYTLRHLEKRGRELEAMGITAVMLAEMYLKDFEGEAGEE